MNRLGLLLAVVLASATSVACATQADDDHEEDVAETEDSLISAPQQQALTCKRFPKDSCVTIGRLCERRGGKLWCDLQGNCTCRLSALQGSPAFAQ